MKGGARTPAMATLREFFSTNEIVVVFGYGLVFFLLGFALTLHARRPSELMVARVLPLLGSFGLLHGVAEWGPVFIPIQATYMPPENIVALWAVHGTMLAMSFAFLLQFGLRLVAEGLPRRFHYLPALAWVVFGAWLAMYVLRGPFLHDDVSIVGWLDDGRHLGPLLACFPRRARDVLRLKPPSRRVSSHGPAQAADDAAHVGAVVRLVRGRRRSHGPVRGLFPGVCFEHASVF